MHRPIAGASCRGALVDVHIHRSACRWALPRGAGGRSGRLRLRVSAPSRSAAAPGVAAPVPPVANTASRHAARFGYAVARRGVRRARGSARWAAAGRRSGREVSGSAVVVSATRNAGQAVARGSRGARRTFLAVAAFKSKRRVAGGAPHPRPWPGLQNAAPLRLALAAGLQPAACARRRACSPGKGVVRNPMAEASCCGALVDVHIHYSVSRRALPGGPGSCFRLSAS